MTFIQRLGKVLNPHFHFHSCIIDGVFDKKGKFYPVNAFSAEEIQVVSDMLDWDNGGFSLNANLNFGFGFPQSKLGGIRS